MENNEHNILITRYLLNSLSEEEVNLVEEKLNSDNEFKQAFELSERIWKQSQLIEFPDFDENKALANISEKIQNKKKSHRGIIMLALKIAAILIVGVFIGLFINKLKKTDNSIVEITVKKGEKLTVCLPDSNKIWLNSECRLSYPADFTGINRQIEIEGEAYFEFTNNKEFPIVVKCGETLLIGNNVLYNIKKNSEEGITEINVENGFLTLTDPTWGGHKMVIDENLRGTITKDLPLFIERSENRNYLAWKTGKLIFDETPLELVAQELSKVYGENIIVKGEVKYCELSSEFDNYKLEQILTIIKERFDIQISESGNRYVLQGNNCEKI